MLGTSINVIYISGYVHSIRFAAIYFMQDRFAIDRFLPPVDESQDWFLVSGEEENGYTILEFTRSLTNCDQNDLDIKVHYHRVGRLYK